MCRVKMLGFWVRVGMMGVEDGMDGVLCAVCCVLRTVCCVRWYGMV